MPTLTKPVAWDAFLGNATEAELKQIESFRNLQWLNIKRDLAVLQGAEVSEEPHWVSPGKAIYWQEQVVVSGGEETPMGWAPTSALPASSARTISQYIQNGLRLRPPAKGVDVEAFGIEAAAPLRESTEPGIICNEHQKGTLVFPTWKAYLRHCQFAKHPPLANPPGSLANRMHQFAYYCVKHDAGFNLKRAAARHVSAFTKKEGSHVSLESMLVSTDSEEE